MKTKVKVPLWDLNYNLLNYFSRADLRGLAHKLNIPVGRDKSDTIYNLTDSSLPVKLTIKIEA